MTACELITTLRSPNIYTIHRGKVCPFQFLWQSKFSLQHLCSSLLLLELLSLRQIHCHNKGSFQPFVDMTSSISLPILASFCFFTDSSLLSSFNCQICEQRGSRREIDVNQGSVRSEFGSRRIHDCAAKYGNIL